MRSFDVAWLVLGLGVLGACSAQTSPTCAVAGTAISVMRSNPAGACPAAVASGVTALNGSDTFMPMMNISCGMVHFTLTVSFFAQDAGHASCMGTETIAMQDFMMTGGTGTDSMAVTCTDGTTCTETFDIDFATP